MMTLKKISHFTGFSVSTISKALNDKHDINEDTKKIIQDFAHKTNYKPNKNALALRSRKSSIVAVIVPRINNTVYSEILYYMQKCASKKGFRTMLFQSFDEVTTIEHYLQDINDGSVDAAIVLSLDKEICIKVNKKLVKHLPVEFLSINEDVTVLNIQQTCEDIFHKIFNNN